MKYLVDVCLMIVVSVVFVAAVIFLAGAFGWLVSSYPILALVVLICVIAKGCYGNSDRTL